VIPAAPGAVLALATSIAFATCALAWLVSRGALHRLDRVGAAAVAVGFAGAYQETTGGGWHPENPASWLPLAAVVTALIGPRLAARLAPEAGVPLAARGFLGSLPSLAERTRVLVATAGDSPAEVHAPRDATEVYEAASAARARRDAERVRDAIIRAGGDALTASAEALPPQVADRYLALKAAGRL